MALQDITVHDWRGDPYLFKIDVDPDSCPICHCAIEPADLKWDFLITTPHRSSIERVFRCPKKTCLHLFIARYNQHPSTGNVYNFEKCVPAELQDYECPTELKTISTDFAAIYNEAHKAEQLGLALVCGPGYRKALEFLIKDYVSLPHAQDDAAKKEISEMPLMGCIKKWEFRPFSGRRS
jgi:hypothetical protein